VARQASSGPFVFTRRAYSAHNIVASAYPAGRFRCPCLPHKGQHWLTKIKHDGFRGHGPAKILPAALNKTPSVALST
jgi:hypothetical protein